MESNPNASQIYINSLKILSEESFSADVFGGLNREKIIPDNIVKGAIEGLEYAQLLGPVQGIVVMQMYDHAKIEPGRVVTPERSQATIHIKTNAQDVFYEFERNPGGEIETRKLLYKTANTDDSHNESHVQFEQAHIDEPLPLYNSYEWVTTDVELITLNGLVKRILSQNTNA